MTRTRRWSVGFLLTLAFAVTLTVAPPLPLQLPNARAQAPRGLQPWSPHTIETTGQTTASANGATNGSAANAPAPPGINLDSPRDTLVTFNNAMRRAYAGYDDAYAAATACLDSPLNGRLDLRGTANDLYDVLRRVGGTLDVDALPDAATLAAQIDAGGPVISRVLLFPRDEHRWVWDKLERAPRGKVWIARSADGRWRFDPATVAGARDLLDSIRDLPPEYEQGAAADDPSLGDQALDLLGPVVHETRWWGWAALAGCIFVGVVVGKVVQSAFGRANGKLTTRGWPLRAAAFEDAAGPANLALITLGIIVGLRFLVLSDALASLTQKITSLLLLVALGWFLYNLIDLVDLTLRRAAKHSHTHLDDMVVPLVRKTLRIFLLIVFGLVVGQNIFGLNITGFLAGLGIAGLAISLAAQDSVKNLFGSLTIFFDRPFVVGELIHFDGNDGVVEEIGFRSTKLRTLDGHLFTVPNMRFIDNSVRNIGARRSIRRVMDITITYDTPPEKIERAVQIVRDILADPAITEPFDLQELPPRVFFNELNADSLNIKAFYWFTLRGGRDYWAFLAHSQEVNLRLFRAFADAEIEFAFPTQTLYLAGDPQRELQVTVAQRGDGDNGDDARPA